MGRIFRRSPRQLVLPGVRVPRKGRRQRSPNAALGPIARARVHLVTAPLTRRRFLSGTLGWVTAAIVAALGVPAAAAVVSPLFRKDARGWSPVARLSKPEPGGPDLRVEGKPLLTHVTSLVQDAYLKASPRDVSIYVVNHGGDEFTVFDVACTHLGCPVTWKEEEGEFFSPCHGGVFDAQGRVLAGPPPRPLDRYEYKVEDDVLYVGKLYQVNDDLERVTF